MQSPPIYRFGGFTLDAATRRLRRNDQELPLEPKSFRLLEMLIQHRHRVLGKEEIFQVIWDQTVVTDNALTRAIGQIRKVLEDDPKHPRFIETLPTIGYRFIGELTGDEPLKPPLKQTPRRRSLVWFATVFATLALVAVAAWRLWPRASKLVLSPPVPLTSYRGNVEAPSFSPDGSQVAFQWDGEKHDNVDIYVKSIGPDAVPLRLTTDSLQDRTPSWSPDGSTIAFVRIIAPGRGELMLIPALGGPERRLTGVALGDDPVWDPMGSVPAWSSNGRWLVIPELIRQHTILIRVSVETGEREQITQPDIDVEEKYPAIAPDGSTLLFVRKPTFYQQGTLYTVGLDENAKPIGDPKPINTHGVSVTQAAWMGNAKEIVARTSGGLFRMALRSDSEAQPIPGTGAAEVQGITVSRRGDRLAYEVVHGDANIWRLDLTARTLHAEPLIASTFRDVAPRYSPDGRTIAFESMRGQGRGQIWLFDGEVNQSKQLTFVKEGLVGAPRWSPDGRSLQMDSNVTGKYQIYTMDAAGGRMVQLTGGEFDNFGVSRSRDDQWLYFTSIRTGRTEVWKMHANGGAAVQVTRNGGEFGVESGDGKTLYFTRILRGDPGSIWRMPVAGGPEEKVADSLYRSNFAVTKRGVYYMTHADESGKSKLMFYDPAAKATSTVLPIGRPELGLDVSPDGRYLLYAQLDDPASGLMLIEHIQ